MCSFGALGFNLGQFRHPGKLAYHPGSGHLLVADTGNKRVQEVKPTGEAVRVINVASSIGGVACTDALVAVGMMFWSAGGKRVMLFQYDSGALVRCFGDWGDGVGRLGRCHALRFTPDGRHVVVATVTTGDGAHKLSQWSVAGEFQKEAGAGTLKFASDVAYAETGDWVACDQVASEMVVFSGADGSETRRWRVAGADALTRPTALAPSCYGELFVLEMLSGRVLVLS